MNFLNKINPLCKNTIMERILEFQKFEIERHQNKEGARNLLNKWFQDSVKNYILEAHAAPLLFQVLDLKSVKEVKQFVHQKINPRQQKYMGILGAYYEALNQGNCIEEFCNQLLDIVNSDKSLKNPNLFHKQLRKQFVCILILYYFHVKLSSLDDINSFFDLWNLCYPQQKQFNKKKSKVDDVTSQTAEAEESYQASGSRSLINNLSSENLQGQQIRNDSPSLISFATLSDKKSSPIELEQSNSPSKNSIQPIYEFDNQMRQMEMPYLDHYHEGYNSITMDAISLTPSDDQGCLNEAFIPETYNCFVDEMFYDQLHQMNIPSCDGSQSQGYFEVSREQRCFEISTFQPFSQKKRNFEQFGMQQSMMLSPF